MIKKLLILCLTLALVISFLPAAGFEAYAAGSTITAPSALQYSDEEWEILMLVNKERYTESLNPLTGFDLMQEVGDIRADELTEYYSHNRPDGTDCFTVIDELNIPWRALGENIAYGYQSPSEVMTGWMNSQGHKENILNENYTHIGIGLQIGTDAIPYWIQMFLGISSYTSFQLVTPENTAFEKGTSIEEMGIYAVLNSSTYGTCYLPIISEYCSGVDVDTSGKQTLSVSVLGYSANVDITIAGDDCAAKIGETAYATLSSAMADAKSGDTVSLQADAVIDNMFIPSGVTLDIGEHTLTADYLIGVNGSKLNAVTKTDTVEGGKLIINKDNLFLTRDPYVNTAATEDSAAIYVIPVWDDLQECYVFSRVRANHREFTIENDTLYYEFGHTAENYSNKTLWIDGSSDNYVSVEIQLKWETVNEQTGTTNVAYQNYVYGDSSVAKVSGGGYVYTFTLTGLSYLGITDIDTLTITPMFITNSGAAATGTTYYGSQAGTSAE